VIDHMGLCIGDYEKSKAFYRAGLKPLGYELLMEVIEAGPHAGFGVGGKPDFGSAKVRGRRPAPTSPWRRRTGRP
jgi:hypothetical protein